MGPPAPRLKARRARLPCRRARASRRRARPRKRRLPAGRKARGAERPGGCAGFGAAGFRGGGGLRAHLTLYQDGSFQLAATFYDGTALITGTYTQEGGAYVLAPPESTAQGVAGSDVGEMRLSPSGGGLYLFRRAAGAHL